MAENTVRVRVTAENDTKTGLADAKDGAKKAGDQAGEAFTRAIRDATDEAGDKVAKQVVDDLKDIEPKAKAAGEDAGEAVSEGVKDGADSGGDGGRGLAGKLFNRANLAAAGATAAAVAGAAFVKSIQKAVDAEMGQAKLTASMMNPEEAKRAGKTAGGLYAEGVGESSDQVRQSVRLAISAGLEGSDKELEYVSRAALNLAEVFDVDVRESINAARALLKSGLAKDGKEAMDIVTGAMQMGDLGDDMIDTITEYSVQFEKLGLTAPSALGMIDQMMAAGARNTDVAADALKEFAIKASDGSKTTAKAYKDLGLDADDMFKKMNSGGEGAAKGMGEIVKKLKGVEDPVKRNALAIALFGTKSEDLQGALMAIDPASAVEAFGDVGNAAGKMGDVLEDTNARKIEKFKRAAEKRLTEFGASVIETFENLAANESVREFAAYWTEEVVPALSKLWKFIKDKVAPVLEDILVAAFEDVKAAIDDFQKAVDENRGELREFWAMIKKVASFLDSDFAKAVGKTMVASFTSAIRAISAAIKIAGSLHRAFHTAKDKITSAARSIRDRLESIRDKAATVKSRIGSILSGMFSPLYAAVDGPVVWAKAKLASLLDFARSIKSKVSTVISGITGGLVGAKADGGISSGGLTMVGERGPELVRLPTGSMVTSNSDTRQMLASTQASQPAMIEIRSSGSRVDDMLLTLLRDAIRVRGGNVQVVLGR